jgi:glutathione S-transferase
MLKIYGRISSINVQKVIWCLEELGKKKGVDYERIDAGLQFGVNKTDDYLKLNPNGLVPTLVDDDFVLWESNAIIRYLSAAYGDGSLYPANFKVRANVDRWMDWALATLWPALRVSYLGLTRTPKEQQDIPLVIKQYQESTRLLAMLNDVLAKQAYSAGSEFTLSDLVLAVAVDRWVGLPASFPEVFGASSTATTSATLPALAAWHRKVTARPAFSALMQK